MQKSQPSNPSSTAEPNDQYTMMAIAVNNNTVQALPFVYTLQCQTGKRDKNKNNNLRCHQSQQQAKDTDRIDTSQ